MFEDRKDAGIKLAQALRKYRKKGVIVLAIPKGGIEVGFYISQMLKVPLDLLIVRKLAFPDKKGNGFGAIAEDGSTFILPKTQYYLSDESISQILKQEIHELKRKVKFFRRKNSLPALNKKIVILVDDGLNTVSTMQAAIMLCRNKKAHKIIVASPVADNDTARHMEKLADEVVVLEKPQLFNTVRQAYENWYDVSDREAALFLQERNHFRKNKTKRNTRFV